MLTYRYLPPKPESESETLFLYLLSMIHKRPFLHMRFPPRGAVACLRAYNDDYFCCYVQVNNRSNLHYISCFRYKYLSH